MEARFIVGPPGTGKTHTWIVKKYKECFSEYNPEKIVLLSHTNVAVGQILDAIMDLKEVKEKDTEENFLRIVYVPFIITVEANFYEKKSLTIQILKVYV